MMASASVWAQDKAVEPPAPMLSNLTPDVANINPFPTVDATQFTASFPTVDTVTAFLKQIWGYDTNRIFQVQAILKSAAPSVSRVVVLVAERGQTQDQVKVTSFLVLNDGKHAISGDRIMDFGATPFAEKRAILEQKATGPAHGAASKDLLLVEFADFQCPHCKDGQESMEKLAKDFPTARIVFENLPLTQIHHAALQAATYSVCVAKLKPGNDNAAFQTFSNEVFAHQDDLTPEKTKATLDAAVTKAGLDPEAVAACSTAKETQDTVKASTDLANELDVDSTPTLFANGRAIPLSGVAYDTLKDIINYQAQLDGLKLPAAAASAPAGDATK
jgi:protein-disulfide isomerase